MYNTINIDHSTLNNCLYLGSLYLDYFFLSTVLIETVSVKSLKIEIIALVINKPDLHKSKHPVAKAMLA